MRDLRFDGLSEDGSRLVLAGKDGQKYTVTIDERLEAAVRRDRARISQVELEQSGGLRPREIQARIRAGATAEDVAAASGLSVEHVRRFEGPVLTERAWVAHQAQATEVRRPGGDIQLGDLVAERLAAEDVDAEDVAWDAWRRDDGLWVVIASFPFGANTHVATWTYDSVSRTMTVADHNAETLSAIDARGPLRLSSPRPNLTAVAVPPDEEPEDEVSMADDAAQAQPESDRPATEDQAASAGAATEDHSASAAADADDQGAEETPPGTQPDTADTADSEQVTAEPVDPEASSDGPALPPEAPPTRGKPALPSLDDILFGPGPKQH